MDTNLCRGQQICDQALLYADMNDLALKRLRLSGVKFLRIKFLCPIAPSTSEAFIYH